MEGDKIKFKDHQQEDSFDYDPREQYETAFHFNFNSGDRHEALGVLQVKSQILH